MSLRTRRVVVLTGFAAALVGVGGIASGAWNLGGVGSGSASANTIGAVTGTGSSATYNSATITWNGVATPVPATSYVVVRTGPTPVATLAGCGSTSCTQSGLSPSTAYTYAITAVRENWSSSPVPVTVTTSASPTTGPTPPAGSAINATPDNGNTPTKGDKFTFAYTQSIAPGSVISGWNGASERVVYVRLVDGGGSMHDSLEVYSDAGISALANLGTVDLGRSDYVTSTAIFGEGTGGNASKLAMSGNVFTLTLGQAASGTVAAGAGGGTLTWTPSSSAQGTNGLAVNSGQVAETGVSDVDF